MIGLRVVCDYLDCERHFEEAAGGVATDPSFGVAAMPARRAGAQIAGVAVMGNLILPDDWTVEEVGGVTFVRCAEHSR